MSCLVAISMGITSALRAPFSGAPRLEFAAEGFDAIVARRLREKLRETFREP